jgi:GNAT superfamily N-acetyltransferase
MTIEIREFEGDAESLAAFIVPHWRAKYAQSGFALNWTPAYFRWQLPEFAAGDARGVISAYEGTTLVGVNPVEVIPITIRGRRETAVMGDWITVDASRAGTGIGRRLWEANRRFAEQHSALFISGLNNTGSLPGEGYRFWKKMTAGNRVLLNKPRTWARVLNGAKLAAATRSRFDQISARVAGWINPIFDSSAAANVRDYRPSDAAACHAVFERYMRQFDLAYRWDQARLAHDLGFGEPAHALILEKVGLVKGFISFSILEMFGRTVMRNGMIDLLVPSDLSTRELLDLLHSALEFMRARDVDVVLAFGPPVNAGSVLARAGFLPMPSSLKCMLIPTNPSTSLGTIKNAYVYLR